MRPTISLASIESRGVDERRLGAGKAVDGDAGAVVAVDAHVVQRERPRLHVGRARGGAREQRDAVAGLRPAPAAGSTVVAASEVTTLVTRLRVRQPCASR